MTPEGRYHSLDGVRAVMMLLGLVLHSFISYGEIEYGEAWPFKDHRTNAVFDWIVFYIHVFRMPVFYVMAGFFAAMLYLRRGPGGLVRNRASRILVPFAVGWVVLWPPIAFGFMFATTAQASGIASGIDTVLHALPLIPFMYRDITAHLWFLYYLLWFYAFFLIVAPLLRRLPGHWRTTGVDLFAALLKSRFRPVWFAVPTALTLCLMPGGILITSPSFIPDYRTFLAYLVFFSFGWLFYLRREILLTFTRHAWSQVILGTVLLPVQMVAIQVAVTPEAGNKGIAFAVIVVVGALVVWLLVFGITGLFLRYLDRHVPVVRYIVDASYWLYLIHLPFTIWVPGLLTGLSWPASVKALVVLLGCTPVWLASYHYLVRSTFIGKVLNGRRYPRRLPV